LKGTSTGKSCLATLGSQYLTRFATSEFQMTSQKNNPLHGVTLENMLIYLVDEIGWEEMGYRINIRCFNYEPSIKSSLTFLRKTPWARKQVEELYVEIVDSNS